jgi:putative ABC transport system permease protein
VLTGLIAVGGLLLYLESRTRARVASYVLSRRMGLRRRSHLASLGAELGVLLGAGLLVGAGLAVAAAYAVHGRLDVAPALAPGPLMPVPIAALVGVAGAVLVVGALGATGAQVSADRVRPAEVMRFDG